MTDATRSASLQVSLPLQDIVEERRRVTVLFADLSGSTALTAKVDPEEARDVMRSYFTKLGRRIQRYGGTVDKYIGDAVMAVFGAPVAHEDDAQRALAAALAIRDAVDELNRELARTHGSQLAVRVGVNTGEVVAGTIAGDVQAAYTVVGDTVNVAKRLEASASSGEILVGAATRSATAHAFELEAAGPIQVKGKDEPVFAYRLIRAKTDLAARPLTQHRVTSPLVGREAELATLVSLVWAVKAGRGGVASVIGEAGSGKSRLIAEVKRAAASAECTWLEGRCFTLGATTRYAPFVEAITRVAGIVDRDDDQTRWAKLADAVRIAVPDDLEEDLPYVAALVGVPAPPPYGEQLAKLSGEAIGRQIFRVSRRVLTALAKKQPLVVVFEDLHWADASTAALIQHLFRASEDAPVLIIGTGRPEQAGPARELRDAARKEHAGRYTELRLRALRDDEATTLIENLLATDDLPAQIRDLIVRRSEGNPLYVEEVIRSLIESGVIRRDEQTGHWIGVGDAARIQIPETISGLILSRIDRLDERSKEVLRCAAALGRSFRDRLLRAVVTRTDLDAILGGLADAVILVERRKVPEPELMFKHALIQEAIYESILKRQRRELHARIASTVESLFAERIDEHVGVLAYHYARAEDWEKAVPYLERAGDQAGQVAADADAVERYREALRAYEATGRASPLQLAVLERKLGEALFRRGEHTQATISLSSALRRLGAPLPDARGALARALAREIARQAGHFLFSGRLPRPSTQATPEVEERYRIYALLAWISYYAGETRTWPLRRSQPRLLLTVLLMINVGESAGYLPMINQGMLGLGVVCDLLGLRRLALRYHTRNVAMADAARDEIAQGYAYFGLAFHEHGVGEWDASEAHWAKGADGFWVIQDLRRWGAAQWAVAGMRARRGDITGVRVLAERMIEVAEDGADLALRAWGLFALARAQSMGGDDQGAIASLRESVAILREIPDRQILVRALGDMGQYLLRRGDLDGATKVLEEARDLIAEWGIRGFHANVVNGLVQAYLERAARAPDERRRWYAKVERALELAARQARVDCGARPGFYRLTGRYDWLRGRRRRAEAAWRASLGWGERLRYQTELGLTHAEIGRWTGRADHFDKALAIFEGMGALSDVDRVKALQAASRA